jgi:hypothetical protein
MPEAARERKPDAAEGDSRLIQRVLRFYPKSELSNLNNKGEEHEKYGNGSGGIARDVGKLQFRGSETADDNRRSDGQFVREDGFPRNDGEATQHAKQRGER